MFTFTNDLERLSTAYVKQFGERIYPRHSIVVATDCALHLLRELSMNVHPKITFNPDEDTLFNFDQAPVRLRHHAPPGRAAVLAHADVPPRKCCDQAAMQTIMLALSKGSA